MFENFDKQTNVYIAEDQKRPIFPKLEVKARQFSRK